MYITKKAEVAEQEISSTCRTDFESGKIDVEYGGDERLLKIKGEIKRRWREVKNEKKVFAPYIKKSEEEIINEFNGIEIFRRKVWYESGNDLSFVANPDYKRAIMTNGNDSIAARQAFEYNCLGYEHNASTILVKGNHFIAMREPNPKFHNEFFKLLMERNVSMVVRLTSDEEYYERHKVDYCSDYVIKEKDQWFLRPKIIDKEGLEQIGELIDYIQTAKWQDDKEVEVSELYNLVQEVRERYKRLKNIGPIAWHCAAGVGRTGTFFAALLIALFLDELLDPSEMSIEKIVLKLSIQRALMVGVVAQYILLYKFTAYYLEQKKNTSSNLNSVKT